MLNFVFYFFAAVTLAGAQQARKDVCTKVNSIIIKESVLKPNEMFAFADSSVNFVINNTKLADIPFKDIAIRDIPKNKIGPFNKVKTDMDNCLKMKNRKEKSDDIFKDFGGIVLKISEEPYKKITKKRDDARKKKKTDEELRPIIFTASKAEFTIDITQKIFDAAIKKFHCSVWQCFVDSSKPVILQDKYKVNC